MSVRGLSPRAGQPSGDHTVSEDTTLTSVREREAPGSNAAGPDNVQLTLPVCTFREQETEEKRRLLNFIVASASWKDGELSANLRPPLI
jgi:hypothetical protein